MTRERYGSLAPGGLNWDSLPLRLFAGGNAKFWNPADLDFSRDRADWETLTDAERGYVTRLCTQFVAGEEAVTTDIQPFLAAVRAEGRLGDELYLTQFAYEEARHTQAFRRWLDTVGVTEDLHPRLDQAPVHRQIFQVELPESLNALLSDPSPAAQVRASVTYNHIVEGTLALTGYQTWRRICVAHDIFPGMRELIGRVADDERRHIAWGTFTCRRHVAADDTNWAVFENRMAELLPLVTGGADDGSGADAGPDLPFGLSSSELTGYAKDQGARRFGSVGSARGRSPAEIDVDYSPVRLEDGFAAEDHETLFSSTFFSST